VSTPRVRRPAFVVALAAVAALVVPNAHAATVSDGAPAPSSGAISYRGGLPSSLVLGRSVQGRSIVAQRQGSAGAAHVLLVLGQMHGSEPRGRDVVRALRTLSPPAGVQVWTISTMNPDGAVAGTRRNAHGVDLNRNFPDGWLPTFSSRIYYPGPSVASEPETRAVLAFVCRLRPDLIVSLHQAFNSVDVGNPKTRTWALRLAAALGLPTTSVPCGGPCAGTLTGWYNGSFPGYAVTVELPASVPAALADRYARGIRSVGARLSG